MRHLFIRKESRSFLGLALLGSVMILGGLSSNVSAGGDRHHQHHRHHAHCGCPAPEYAGNLTIDGRTTRIRSDRPINKQIAKAFRIAGYDACVINGKVEVDYGCYRPNIRWRTDRYKASFCWDYGELSVSVRRHYRSGFNVQRRHPVRRAPRRSYRWGLCD